MHKVSQNAIDYMQYIILIQAEYLKPWSKDIKGVNPYHDITR